MQPPHQLRKYQAAALAAFEAAVAQGQKRVSLVLPPGGGKTFVGLEAARRLGRPTLVLAPSLAVQAQWIREWAGYAGVQPASSSRDLAAGVCVLTYQSVAIVDAEAEADERRSVLRSGDTAALLGQLHPRGRELIDTAAARAKADGPWTLVLDECHHLLALWGGLLRAVVETLGPDTVVLGLTATPPDELTGWQAELQEDLFHGCAYSVPTPSLVREGDLAPFQELLFLTGPTEDEQSWLAGEVGRFASLTAELADVAAGQVSLLGWLSRRVGERREEADGAALPWRTFAAAEPELAAAATRFAGAGLIPMPPGATLAERDHHPPDARDWGTVLADYADGYLEPRDDAESQQLLAQLRGVLPGLGLRLTKAGTRATTSPVDRLVALSSAKHAAAVQILDAEWTSRGGALRALVVTDFEAEAAQLPASLREVRAAGTELTAVAGGSALAALRTLAAASVAGTPGGLRPVLVTGRLLAAAPAVAAALIERSGRALTTRPLDAAPGLVEVVGGADFGPAEWTAVATAHLVAGDSHCLIGTRGLLGEGWDCPAVNVVVDLTSAGTATSVAQLRGRSRRLDPADPLKIASNWTVACIADGHPRGDADWLRAVRKHRSLLAPDAAGDIATGIGHCLPAGAEAAGDGAWRLAVNAASLTRAADLVGARASWRIGEAYAGELTAAVRIRPARDLGVPAAAVPARLELAQSPYGAEHARRWTYPAALLPAVAFAGGAVAGEVTIGAEVVALAACAAAAVTRRARSYRAAAEAADLADPTGAQTPPVLADLAAAVADGLHTAGLTPVGADHLALGRDRDGWAVISLTAPEDAAELFRAALDQLLQPVAEPRHLVARPVVPLPRTASGRRRLALATTFGRRVPATVVWHGVPSMLGRSKAGLTAFLDAWSERVCGGRPAWHLATNTPEGQAVLDVVAGLDPFGVLTQMRTAWT